MFYLHASLAVSVLASAAEAGVISVYPGPSAIQTAIAAASPGDTLRVHSGTYPERVVINKPLRLVGAGAKRVIIDAGCTVMYALVVTRNAVADSGDVGLGLEQSEGCLITRNVVSCQVADLADDGVANCWQQNKYTTGSVTSSCPP